MSPLSEFNAESLGQLKPAQLIQYLRQLTPSDPEISNLDINDLGLIIDPKRLKRSEFVQLLTLITNLAEEGARLNVSAMQPETFAAIMTRATNDQIEAVMAVPTLRRSVLDEVFRRMSEHYRTERAPKSTIVVHWRITGGSGDGGFDRYETVLTDGKCVVNHERTMDPRVTITMGPAEFLKLATGNGSAPVMFMTGKLRVKGDLGFAATLMSLFDIPKA